jgi:hypothetical protein
MLRWFRISLSFDLQKKYFFLLLFEDVFTSFIKDKKPKRSHKTLGIEVFLTILNYWRIRIRIRIHTSDYWIRIREPQKNLDPVDPDPEHCFFDWIFCNFTNRSSTYNSALFWTEFLK